MCGPYVTNPEVLSPSIVTSPEVQSISGVLPNVWMVLDLLTGLLSPQKKTL